MVSSLLVVVLSTLVCSLPCGVDVYFHPRRCVVENYRTMSYCGMRIWMSVSGGNKCHLRSN